MTQKDSVLLGKYAVIGSNAKTLLPNFFKSFERSNIFLCGNRLLLVSAAFLISLRVALVIAFTPRFGVQTSFWLRALNAAISDKVGLEGCICVVTKFGDEIPAVVFNVDDLWARLHQ